MEISAVIGAMFGDEGKGNFVNYLCQNNPSSLVIRFSGGNQCSHTVVRGGVKHVFSNFGSGTLEGAPTYLSRFVTVNPQTLLNELEVLEDKRIHPLLFIDVNCPIITPYDILFNREKEKQIRIGSCGVGFGATIEREEKHYSLVFGDLFYSNVLLEKIRLIENYYRQLFSDSIPYVSTTQMFDSVYLKVAEFINSCGELRTNKHIKSVYGVPKGYRSYIFEGSQGLLLDQHYGFFPNVTRSNTGSRNILKLIEEHDFLKVEHPIDIYLVTRAYQTRHGKGYMTNEALDHNIKVNPNETNVFNKHQGNFRRSLLDVSLLRYAINKDEYIRRNPKSLVITCLDHVENEHRYTYADNVVICENEEVFIKSVSDLLSISSVYLSKSEESSSIYKYDNK